MWVLVLEGRSLRVSFKNPWRLVHPSPFGPAFTCYWSGQNPSPFQVLIWNWPEIPVTIWGLLRVLLFWELADILPLLLSAFFGTITSHMVWRLLVVCPSLFALWSSWGFLSASCVINMSFWFCYLNCFYILFLYLEKIIVFCTEKWRVLFLFWQRRSLLL